MRIVVSLACVALFSSVAFAGDAASAFPAFCDEWMGKLAARERDNVAHIKWDKGAGGVKGEYVGYYTQNHTCTSRELDGVPVGKIVYREVRYEKHGETVADAEKSTPQAIDATEVTEIFRYANGKWIY